MGVTIGIVTGSVMVILSLLFRDDLGVLRNLVLIWGTPLAILLALWRSMVAEKQVKIAQEQVAVGQRGLLSDRYQRAVEMLGRDIASVRIGGIYALRNLALEHYDEYGREVWNLLNIYSIHPYCGGPDTGNAVRATGGEVGTVRDTVVTALDRKGRVIRLSEGEVAQKAADAILEHENRIAQGKSIIPWWEVNA